MRGNVAECRISATECFSQRSRGSSEFCDDTLRLDSLARAWRCQAGGGRIVSLRHLPDVPSERARSAVYRRRISNTV